MRIGFVESKLSCKKLFTCRRRPGYGHKIGGPSLGPLVLSSESLPEVVLMASRVPATPCLPEGQRQYCAVRS